MRQTVSALAFLLLVFSLPALASESFTLNVPLHFNAMSETGEVRITLTLNAAPAGAQLVVNSATTLNLGDTATVGGDSISFTAGTGNEARITYRPLSNFPPNNLCDGSAATEKNIPLRFSGAQDITLYRITTYIVAAPDFECSKATKRSGEAPATLIAVDDGVAPALVATNGGRHPIDLLLVLDKSGSMNDLPPEVLNPPVKSEILQSAVQAFLAAWRESDQPIPGGAEWSHDRIGVVFFDSTAAAQTITGADPPTNVFVQRGTNPPGPSHNWSNVDSTVAGLIPGGSTSIGAAINTALSQWQADPDNDLFIILVTDGIQNTAPLVATNPSGILTLPPVAGFPDELRERFIPIQTIGFGQPDTVDENLLREISHQTSGVSYLSVNATTMYNFFASMLVAILKGNTLSIAMQHNDTMTGAGPSAAQNVVVDPSAQRVVFSVQWAPPLREALDLEVFRPGSSTPATPTSGETTPQAVFKTFDMSAGDVGTWSVRVKRKSSQGNVPYSLTAFVLERHLDYRVSFDTSREGTGDTIKLRATLSYDGKALTKLPANAIRVRIQRPPQGLGTLLHDAPFSDNNGNTTKNGDVVTPYQRKVAGLGDALERTLARDVDTIALTEVGHGVYSGAFSGTTTPGTYGFDFTLDWDDPRTGHVHREERLEQRVRVKPDPAMTQIVTTRAADNTVLVSVTPRDKFGNYLGPGYDSLVNVTLNGAGTLGGRTDPHLAGTYVFTINDVPAGQLPDATVIVDGVNVGNASSGGSSSSSSKWRVFLDAGANDPQNDFSPSTGGRWSVNAGLERLLSPAWSVEGILGYHRFSYPFDDPHVTQLSLGAKRYFGSSPWRPFVNAAVGAYHFDPLDDTRPGGNVGAGVLYEVHPKFFIEGVANEHILEGSMRFATVQFGLRWAF